MPGAFEILAPLSSPFSNSTFETMSHCATAFGNVFSSNDWSASVHCNVTSASCADAINFSARASSNDFKTTLLKSNSFSNFSFSSSAFAYSSTSGKCV